MVLQMAKKQTNMFTEIIAENILSMGKQFNIQISVAYKTENSQVQKIILQNT